MLDEDFSTSQLTREFVQLNARKSTAPQKNLLRVLRVKRRCGRLIFDKRNSWQPFPSPGRDTRIAQRCDSIQPTTTVSMPAIHHNLWSSISPDAWLASLEAYESVIARQNVAKLPDLDAWYRYELPDAISQRTVPHIVHAELVKVAEWKMARGVWRAPNLVLVKNNAPDTVVSLSTEALDKVPHPTAPIATLAKLDGVGPATASAVAAAFAPNIYPFFDELVAAQIPTLSTIAWTMGYYAKYAVVLRERATQLGGQWTPVTVERALWANVGGKTGLHP